MTDKTLKLLWSATESREIEATAIIDDIDIHRPFTVNLVTGEIVYDTKTWTASHIPTGTKLVSLITPPWSAKGAKKNTVPQLKQWARLVQDGAPTAWALMSTFEFGKSNLVGDERVAGTMIIEASRAAWAEVRGD